MYVRGSLKCSCNGPASTVVTRITWTRAATVILFSLKINILVGKLRIVRAMSSELLRYPPYLVKRQKPWGLEEKRR